MVHSYNFSDVFISYSRVDQQVAKRIGTVLTERGYEIWADWDDIPHSVEWWSEIQAGIESANIFAFLISPDSAKSDVCRQEIQHAVENNKRIVPILYRKLLSSDETILHPAIRTHNWMTFEDTTDDSFEESLTKLIQVVTLDIDHVRAHTRYLVRAREWANRNRETSFLLQGTDAHEAEDWLAQAPDKDPAPTPLQYQYITASHQQRLQDEFMEQQQNLLLFVERRALPTFLISGGSAGLFIFLTMNGRENLSLLNQLTVALGGLLITGLFVAAIGLFADDLVRIRFRDRFWSRLLVSTIYSTMFGSAICGVVQLVNYGTLGFDWRSIFVMGFFFGFGFAMRAVFQINVWLATILVTISIQLGSWFTLGIPNYDSALMMGILKPVFHYDNLWEYLIVGTVMTYFQAMGVYAVTMWQNLKNLMQPN